MRTFFSLVLCLSCASFAWAEDKPALFEIEVTIAEWNAKAKEGAALPEVDYKAIEKSGALTVLQRVKLTTLSEMPAVVQIGERRPEVTGATFVGGGGARFGGADGARAGGAPPRIAQSITYMNYGTLVNAKATGNADRIIVELMVERSGPGPAKGPVIAEGGEGADGPEGGRVRATVMNTVKAQGTVALKSGDTVVVTGSNGREGDSTGGQVVLLTAKVVK